MAGGDTVKALDAPPAVWFDENTDSQIVNTGYSSTAGTPTLPVCGIAFTAPTSGRVRVTFKARFECKTNASRTIISAAVATGGVAGAGTVITPSSDDNALETTQSATGATTPAETRYAGSTYRNLQGLTPGVTYNAYLEHKNFSATGGTIYLRGIMVEPLS
jgi:hypothetical protein